MIRKNISLLIICAGATLAMFSEGQHRGLLVSGVWLLAVGFGMMFRKIFSGE